MKIEFTQVMRNRSFQCHLLAFGIFFVLSLIILREFVIGDSLFLYRDMNPVVPGEYLDQAVSVFDLESARRILYYGPYASVADVLGVSMLNLQKTSLILTHLLIGFLGYLGCYKLLMSKFSDKHRNAIFAVALFFGFFYLLNPRVAEGLSLTGLGFGLSFSLIPLIFYYYDKTLNTKGFYNIFVTSVLIALAVAASMQYLILIPLFVLLPWLTIVTIKKWREKVPILPMLKNAMIMVGLWSLLSAYWLSFTFLTFLEGSVPQPSYIVTNQSLDVFSSTTALENGIRLLGAWWPWVELTPIVDEPVWLVLTIIIPLSALLSVILVKDRKIKFYSVSFALLMMLVLFVSKGSQPPFPDAYSALLQLPVVGWMFRVPSSIGKFLPFYMGMIISFGLYELLSLVRYARFVKYVKLAAPSVLIASISLISWPMFTGDFGGAYKDSEPANDVQVASGSEFHGPRISGMSLAQIESNPTLDAISMNSFDRPSNHALILADVDLSALQALSAVPEKTFLNDGQDLYFYFLDQDSVILTPFSSTMNHDPANMWSKAGTHDPLHGPFHPSLKRFGVDNDQTDYGRGLVFTWSDDVLTIPATVNRGGDYYIYIRYLENEAGGKMGISLGDFATEVNSETPTNRFVWKQIGSQYLSEGKHSLVLRNELGLNAVNMFALVPHDSVAKITSATETFVNQTKLVYSLEGASFAKYGNLAGAEMLSVVRDGDQFVIDQGIVTPPTANHLLMQFWIAPDPALDGTFEVEDISITAPEGNLILLSSDFEDNSDLDTMHLNSDLFMTLDIQGDDTNSGNRNMRVHMDRGETAVWQTVSTEQLTARGNVQIKYQFVMSSNSTSSPHAKLFYYDANHKIIDDEILFVSPNNAYTKAFEKILVTPPATAFVSLQFWAQPDPDAQTAFTLDDISIEQVIPDVVSQNSDNIFRPGGFDSESMNVMDRPLVTDIKADESGRWVLIETSLLPTIANMPLDVFATLHSTNVEDIRVVLYYYSPLSEAQQSLIEAASTQSADRQILLPDDSGVVGNVALLKTSTYTMALNITKLCQECQPIEVSIGPVSGDFDLVGDHGTSSWYYLTRDLTKGNTPIHIQSESAILINELVVYSDSFDGEKIDDIFGSESPVQPSALILDYQEISPTLYNVKVTAERPFMLTLDRGYSGFWKASVSGEKYDSVRVHPSVNGFLIDKTGQLEITLEYELQRWFVNGSIITIVTFIISSSYFILSSYKVNGIPLLKILLNHWMLVMIGNYVINHTLRIPLPNRLRIALLSRIRKEGNTYA